MPAERARLMQLTLDRSPLLGEGDALPPLWHWLYFNEPVRQSDLGPDGHERLGLFLPPVRYPHRMWAGGDIRFEAPLVLGRPAEQTSRIEDVTFKQGRSGPLCFVAVRHRITQDGCLAVDETQTIVYRDAHALQASPAGAGDPCAPPASANIVRIGRTQLFRYSALTFNAHRIHYDVPFALETEGYPGLVVHGPLLATLLLEHGLSLDKNHQPDRFTFRAERPVFEDEAFWAEDEVDGDSAALRLVKAEGGVAMRGTLAWREGPARDKVEHSRKEAD